MTATIVPARRVVPPLYEFADEIRIVPAPALRTIAAPPSVLSMSGADTVRSAVASPVELTVKMVVLFATPVARWMPLLEDPAVSMKLPVVPVTATLPLRLNELTVTFCPFCDVRRPPLRSSRLPIELKAPAVRVIVPPSATSVDEMRML